MDNSSGYSIGFYSYCNLFGIVMYCWLSCSFFDIWFVYFSINGNCCYVQEFLVIFSFVGLGLVGVGGDIMF